MPGEAHRRRAGAGLALLPDDERAASRASGVPVSCQQFAPRMPSDVLILVTTGTFRIVANRFLTLACPHLTAIVLTCPNFARTDSQAECRRFDPDHPLHSRKLLPEFAL